MLTELPRPFKYAYARVVFRPQFRVVRGCRNIHGKDSGDDDDDDDDDGMPMKMMLMMTLMRMMMLLPPPLAVMGSLLWWCSIYLT